MRSAFEELVRIENSTGFDCESTRVPSLFQEKPAFFSNSRARERASRMRKRGVDPEPISGRYLAPKRRGAAAVHQPNDAVAINRRGHRLTETDILKPNLFAGDLRQIVGSEVVQVEE